VFFKLYDETKMIDLFEILDIDRNGNIEFDELVECIEILVQKHDRALNITK